MIPSTKQEANFWRDQRNVLYFIVYFTTTLHISIVKYSVPLPKTVDSPLSNTKSMNENVHKSEVNFYILKYTRNEEAI